MKTRFNWKQYSRSVTIIGRSKGLWRKLQVNQTQLIDCYLHNLDNAGTNTRKYRRGRNRCKRCGYFNKEVLKR